LALFSLSSFGAEGWGEEALIACRARLLRNQGYVKVAPASLHRRLQRAMTFPIFPPQGSRFSTQVDHLYFALLAFSAAMVLIIVLPMIYFIFKYRRGKKANRREPRLPELTIEVTWIAIPLLLMMSLFG